MINIIAGIIYVIIIIRFLIDCYVGRKYRVINKHSKEAKHYTKRILGLAALIVVYGFIWMSVAIPDDNEDSHPKSSKVQKASDDDNDDEDDSDDTDSNDEDDSDNTLGTELDEDEVKPGPDNDYYIDKTDHKIRYFVDDDDKITAVKVVFTPDSGNTVTVQSYLSERILNDKHLKYTNDKDSEDDTLLDNDGSYNVYSPKNKKWYHISIQASNDGDDKVSQFSAWPGKDPDAE